MLLLDEGFTNKGFQSNQVIISTALVPETTLEFCNYIICFKVPNESFIDHALQCFAYTARLSNRTVIVWVRIIFARFRYWNYRSFFPRLRYITSFPDAIKCFQKNRKRRVRKMFHKLVMDIIRTRR